MTATPDTAALRAYVLSVVGELKYGDQEPEVAADAIMVRVDRALCDAADEVERLRANGNGYLQRAHAAEAVIERMRCAHCGEVGCDWIGDIRKARAEMAEAERDASRTAHAALVADLRALRSRSGYVLAADLRTLLDRHAPEETT